MVFRRFLLSFRGLIRCESGNLILLEFALGLPVFCLMLVGMVDLGHYGLQRAAMLEGSRAGAEYGVFIVSTQSLTSLSTSNAAAISSTAQNATGLTGVTATSSLFCECVAGTTVACTTTCGTGTLKMYVTVTTNRTFTPLFMSPTQNFGNHSTWTPPTAPLQASMTMIVP